MSTIFSTDYLTNILDQGSCIAIIRGSKMNCRGIGWSNEEVVKHLLYSSSKTKKN